MDSELCLNGLGARSINDHSMPHKQYLVQLVAELRSLTRSEDTNCAQFLNFLEKYNFYKISLTMILQTMPIKIC